MDQRDFYCPYLYSSKNTVKPTVLTYLQHMTTGQEDPFELDSNLLLSSGRHGEDCKRQYNVFGYYIDHETPLLIDLADLLY